jgi:hypothetical protein
LPSMAAPARFGAGFSIGSKLVGGI